METQKEIQELFNDHIVRVLVEISHYITDDEGCMLLTHTDTIETDSSSISYAHNFGIKNKSVTVNAKEIRLYGKTASPIHLLQTIKLDSK